MYNVNVQFALVEVRVRASGTQELPQNLVLGGSAVSPQLSPSGADIIANIALKLGFSYQTLVSPNVLPRASKEFFLWLISEHIWNRKTILLLDCGANQYVASS